MEVSLVPGGEEGAEVEKGVRGKKRQRNGERIGDPTTVDGEGRSEERIGESHDRDWKLVGTNKQGKWFFSFLSLLMICFHWFLG